jgi:hypothetical protein
MHIVDSFLRLPISVSETAHELGGKDFATILNIAGLRVEADETPDTTVFIPRQMAVTAKTTPVEMMSLLRSVFGFHGMVLEMLMNPG